MIGKLAAAIPGRRLVEFVREFDLPWKKWTRLSRSALGLGW